MKKIITYIFNLPGRPSYVRREDIKVQKDGAKVDITMFGSYHITINPIYDETNDGAYCDGGGAYGVRDLDYAANILHHRDEIYSMVFNEPVYRAPK